MAHLVVGTGMAGFSGDSAVIGATRKLVPGAAGTTYPIERLGIDVYKRQVESGTLDLALLDRSVKRVLEFVVKSHTFAGYEYPLSLIHICTALQNASSLPAPALQAPAAPHGWLHRASVPENQGRSVLRLSARPSSPPKLRAPPGPAGSN